ncbi:hypothetical protein [Psychrobium sp. 1_MG-2023]|uniref:hypothetical protein n=1 Tax=Psychrobium sp. 1_MG-2023 TaxID=3062624 RepID=UPI000C3216FD|nr:hypothetical protein [Psychrobium sp. 1_MG-2023]MDP2562140.1 hypothetical protein [Psychrobium sp. 1_MG-2023]PKF57183.1 hypothetical protein CW748_07300 [Alteromonadales bacterium alter-6D02]
MKGVGIAQEREKLTLRDTIVVTRKQISEDFLHPEKVRLQLDRKTRVNPLDLGALAYTTRQPQRNTYLAGLPYYVDESSFMLARRKLLIVLHDYVATTGNTDKTVYFHLSHFIRIITWLDDNGYSLFSNTQTVARQGYCAYVSELNHQIKSVDLNQLTPKAANEYQHEIIKLLSLLWGHEVAQVIIREIPLIKYKNNGGVAPDERNVRFATRTFLHLARGFSSFIMKNKAFPYLLNMSDYECYVFPSNANACVTPYTNTKNYSYHYEAGRISTPEEYMAKCPRRIGIGSATKEIESSKANLIAINSNVRDVNRLNYASLALNSYMQVFVLMTGIYPSELVQLEYDASFTLEKDLLKNDFRAIKMRAAGREVVYSLGNRKGLEIFKEYIQLRNWVLDGEDCRFLFFTMKRNSEGTKKYQKMKADYVYKYYRSLSGKFLPISFEAITARKVRKYKTVVWNEIDIAQRVIANSLNHSLKTNHNYYAVSNPNKQQEEFALFWESANAASQRITIKLVNENDSGSISTASGHCDDFKHPQPMQIETPISPDCNSQIGCLYCEHYVCHADEEDIRKLYSLLYVINAVRNMATDYSHSDALLLELSMRIHLVLQLMEKKYKNIQSVIENIKQEVMGSGLLTPFWEYRLQRYEQMGVIING